MRVQIAGDQDIPAWLVLAAEVEPLFGPLVDDPGFAAALWRAIEHGTAVCVRQADGPPGAPLLGGLLFSPRRPDRPDDRIGWLAVTAAARRQGIGRQLVQGAIDQLATPALVTVITFAADDPEGAPARAFYVQLGFQPAEPLPAGPNGRARQRFRRVIA